MTHGKTASIIAAETLRLSNTQLATLTGMGDIKRRTTDSDGRGGSTEIWETMLANVECAVNSARSGSEDQAGNELSTTAAFYLHLPPGTDIRAEDRFYYEGATYEIREVMSPVTEEALVECRMEWIE